MVKISGHPFSGRKGAALRDRFAGQLFEEQQGKCRMCATPVIATLRGTKDPRAAVVDHIKPWRMCPDMAYDKDNLQLICRACHARCDGIESNYKGDADMIAEVKARQAQSWG